MLIFDTVLRIVTHLKNCEYNFMILVKIIEKFRDVSENYSVRQRNAITYAIQRILKG